MNKVLTIILLLPAAVKGYSQFTLTGEIRPRIEFRDGYKTLLSDDQKPALVTTQRSRLNLIYKDDRLSFRFSLQDSRTWGETPAATDASTMNIFEAWAEWFISPEFSLKAGRQELAFDNNRLFGTRNWNNLGNSHDMLLLQYSGKVGLHAGFAYNNDKAKNYESNYPVDFYKTLVVLRGEKDFGKYLNASAAFINDGFQKEDSDDTIYYRNTYGGNLSFGNDSVRTGLYGAFYYQSGKSQEGQSIKAYFASLNLSYDISPAVNASLAIDYASGDNALKPDNHKNSFNNLYGNGHSYYGYMDYFSKLDEDTEGSGLIDIYARITSNFGKKSSGEFTYHYFRLANNAIDSLSSPGNLLKADRGLGSEIDLLFKNKPAKNIEINIGYSMMFASPTMELIKGGNHKKFQQWAYVMLLFKPEFYSSNKQK